MTTTTQEAAMLAQRPEQPTVVRRVKPTGTCEKCGRRTKVLHQVERFELGQFFTLCAPDTRKMEALPLTRRFLENI